MWKKEKKKKKITWGVTIRHIESSIMYNNKKDNFFKKHIKSEKYIS